MIRSSGAHAIGAGTVAGAVAYFLLVPIETLFHPVVIRANGLELELETSVALRGLVIVALVAIGTACAVLAFSYFSRPTETARRAPLPDMATPALGSLLLLVIGLPFSEIQDKASSLQSAQRANEATFLVALYSFLMTVSGCLCGLAFGQLTSRGRISSAMIPWLICVGVVGGLGLVAGDKNPLGGVALGMIFGFLYSECASWRVLGLAVVFTSLAMLASGPFNSLKFLLFGFGGDLANAFVPPSRLDPSTPFAITVSAFDNLEPLGVIGFNSWHALAADAAVLVPRAIVSEREATGATMIAEQLMGPSYFPGAGYGYSPYVDLIALLGPAGAALGAFCTTICLLFSNACVRGLGGDRVSDSGAGVLACMAVLIQRTSLCGALKTGVYASILVLASFAVGRLLQRTCGLRT